MWFTTNRAEVVCLDIGPLRRGHGEPRIAWKVDMIRDLGVFPYGTPMATARRCSVAGYGEFIYVITGNGVDADHIRVPAPGAPSLICLNKATGKLVWSNNSPGKSILQGQWASPLVIEIKGQPQVIAPLGDGWVRSFDARSGKLLWEFDTNPKDSEYKFGRGTRNNLLAAPVYADGHVFIGNGHHPESETGLAWLYCIDPTKRGDISPELLDGPGKGKPNPNSGMVWRYGGANEKPTRYRPYRFQRTVSNVVVHEGLVIAADIGGLVHCLDARTGAEYWNVDTRGAIHGSPLIVGGNIYVGNDAGDVWILGLAKEKKVHGTIEMEGRIRCSPIFAHGVLYIVAGHRLYAIAGGQPEVPSEQEAAIWPQWRGPDRTNVSRETGLLRKFPPEGPPLAWKADGLGTGARSVAVAGGRLFTLGYRGDAEWLHARDAESGKPLWQIKIGPSVPDNPLMQWLSQRTPTIDDRRVYALNGDGVLHCVAAEDGKTLWKKDYVKEFGGAPGVWGFCDYPLVDGDRLICTPGGGKATLVALDKRTGALLWKCPVPGEQKGTHAPVVLASIAGTQMLIHHLHSGTFGVRATDGKLLWRFAETGFDYGNVHAALVKNDHVFCANAWHNRAFLLKIVPDAEKWNVEVVARSKLKLDPWLGNSVLLGDQIHTSCGQRIDWNSGKKLERLDLGEFPTQRMTMTCAEGRLYHRTGENAIYLTEVTPKGYVPAGKFDAPQLSGMPTWVFPVIAGGKLYLRDQDFLLCYDISGKKDRPRPPDAIFVPTPQDVVEKMLELAMAKKTDRVYDLGCGDGRIVVTAAKKYGCHSVGIDLDPECVKLALAYARKENVERLVTIERKDLFTVDLTQADVLALYLLPRLNVKLLPQLAKLKPGARIVSHEFPIAGIRPDRIVRYRSHEDGVEHTIYVWTSPLRKEH